MGTPTYQEAGSHPKVGIGRLESKLNTVLWWVIGIVISVIVLGVVSVELYRRTTRKRERHLSHRPKRRIEL